ncbi:hypothetical protein KDA_43250 [Dictyobacter alpinus]|uniref:Transposase IS200-like domain-containing protein n=2 Tax=Dictyobacter alpinus TaxID=2014873 RepID=A0A402BBN5_9CHLR|nr:hypothetical protein KDA_43250 [Dictyobacter alpinus]
MHNHIHGILTIEIEDPEVKSVIEMICGYKSCAANAWLRYIKENNIDLPGKIWQSKFYDHIIRGEQDFKAQHTYILNNPAVFEERRHAQANEKERKQSQSKDQEQSTNEVESDEEL